MTTRSANVGVVVVVVVVSGFVVVIVVVLERMFGVRRPCFVTTGNDETIVCRLNADFCCFGNSLLIRKRKSFAAEIGN